MNILIFDIESNGLPKDYKGSVHDLDNWPRVIQLAWEVCNDAGEVVTHYSSLVKPENWEIPKEKFWIDHGYSTEESLIKGAPMTDILDLFLNALHECEILVAHNMAFDHSVLSAEMIRYQKKAQKILFKVCTMQSSVDLCKIPFSNDSRPWKQKSYKWPRLEELHKHLFNNDFEGAHDAGHDVTACRLCFFEMLKRGIISLDDVENVLTN